MDSLLVKNTQQRRNTNNSGDSGATNLPDNNAEEHQHRRPAIITQQRSLESGPVAVNISKDRILATD